MKIFLIILTTIINTNIFANTFFIDPINGSDLGNGSIISPWKTLENVINNKLIESKSYRTPYDPSGTQLIDKNSGAPVKTGDTLMLYSGLHGTIDITNYVNDKYITVLNVTDNVPIFKSLRIRGGKKWRFKGITISSEPYGNYINNKLVFLESHNWQGPVSSITIQDCFLFSAQTAWTDTTNWQIKASDGIYIKGDSITINNNHLKNIRFGIVISGNDNLVSENTIMNFSADGIRLIGSNCIVEKNIIKNCYDIDSNHDDGIQAFTTGGHKVDNNIIRQNIILNYEDPNQPLLGNLQGIGCFDGPFRNWEVENNLVIVNHWHGISFYGFINSKIINNTVLDPTPDILPGPSWIKIEDNLGYLSKNNIVKNNVVNKLSITPNTTAGNNMLLNNISDYNSNFVNYSDFDYHLLQTSALINVADSTVAPDVDLDGNTRPSGNMPDIGAYEFQFAVSKTKNINNQFIKIFPNPFTNYIEITGPKITTDIRIFDYTGSIVFSIDNVDLPKKINLTNLNKGIYYFQLSYNKHNYRQINILIKTNNK